MKIFLTVLHVLVCLELIVIVLLQRGKGAEIGAMFGGGGSATLFGSRGAGTFLTRLTTYSAVVFMVTSLGLAWLSEQENRDSLFEGEETPVESPFAAPDKSAPEAGASAFEEVPAPAPAPAPTDAAPGAATAPTEQAPAPADAKNASETPPANESN